MLKILILCLLLTLSPAWAQESVGAGSVEKRLELADEILALNPPRDQVRAAVTSFVDTQLMTYKPEEKEIIRVKMLEIINYRALEQLSREAYAEIFTEKELAAMLEYYAKPESISARDKVPEFNQRIYPEIIKMLDTAYMKARTAQ